MEPIELPEPAREPAPERRDPPEPGRENAPAERPAAPEPAPA